MNAVQVPFQPPKSAMEELANLTTVLQVMLRKGYEENDAVRAKPCLLYAGIFIEHRHEVGGIELGDDDRLTVLKINADKMTPEILREMGADCDENLERRINELEDVLFQVKQLAESPEASGAPIFVVQQLREILKEL